MSEFVVAAYDDQATAEHVLGLLRAQRDELNADLTSVAIVRVGNDGGVTVIATARPGSANSFSGVFWEIFFGLVFLVPTPCTGYGSNLGGLFGAIDRAGLDDDFRVQVRSAFQHGCSGLAVRAIDWDPVPVLDQLYVRPDLMLRRSLSSEQDAELVRELGGDSSC